MMVLDGHRTDTAERIPPWSCWQAFSAPRSSAPSREPAHSPSPTSSTPGQRAKRDLASAALPGRGSTGPAGTRYAPTAARRELRYRQAPAGSPAAAQPDPSSPAGVADEAAMFAAGGEPCGFAVLMATMSRSGRRDQSTRLGPCGFSAAVTRGALETAVPARGTAGPAISVGLEAGRDPAAPACCPEGMARARGAACIPCHLAGRPAAGEGRWRLAGRTRRIRPMRAR